MPESIEVQINGSLDGLTEALDGARGQLESFAAPLGGLVDALGALSDAFESVEGAKQAAREKQAIEKEDADHTLQMAKIKLDAEKDGLDGEVAAGKITAAQKIATLKDLADQEYQIELDALDKELAALDSSAANYQSSYKQLYDKIETLTAEHDAAMAKLDRQAAQQQAQLDKQRAAESQKTWTGVTNTIDNAMDQMLSGILRGTQTPMQALTRLFDNMAISFIESIAKMGVAWAVHQAQKLALETTTDTAVAATHEAMNAATSASDAAQNISPTVLKHAGSAAAAVYDDVAQIPYVGWLLAPPAAAAAFAAVAAFSSFDVGAWSLPSDMLAMVHQGEMIVPADVAAQIRSGGSVASFASGAGSNAGAGGSVQIVFNNNVSAIDGPSVVAHANRYAQTYAAAIGKALARNPSLRGAY